jgi:hypothetical protein
MNKLHHVAYILTSTKFTNVINKEKQKEKHTQIKTSATILHELHTDAEKKDKSKIE